MQDGGCRWDTLFPGLVCLSLWLIEGERWPGLEIMNAHLLVCTKKGDLL